MNKLIGVCCVGLIVLLSSCVSFPDEDGNRICKSDEAIRNSEKSDIKTPNPFAVSPASSAKTATQSEKLSFSLRESIRIALAHNRQLAMSQEEKNKAQGRLTEAQSGLYPRVKLTGSYTRVDESAQAELGGQTIEFGKLNNYKAELGLTQPLYTGGRVSSGLELARLGIKYSEDDFRNAEELIIFLVSKSYYDVLLAQETVETNRKSLELVKAHLDEVTKIRKQGMIADYDLLRAQVQVSNLNTVYLQSVNQLHLTRTSFINILGLPLGNDEQSLTLTDKFVYEPVALLSEDKVRVVAFDNRADLNQARLRVSIQQKSLDLIEGERLPTFALFGNVGEANPPQSVMGGSGWDNYWNAGGVVSWSLFEGGRIQGKIIQEKSALRQVQISLRDMEEKVRLEIRQALLNLKDTEELVKSQSENVKQAEEGLRLARIGYEQGVRTQLEVLDSQMALDSARKNMAGVIYAHILARVMLDKAMGILGRK
jgi:outer membrane protein